MTCVDSCQSLFDVGTGPCPMHRCRQIMIVFLAHGKRKGFDAAMWNQNEVGRDLKNPRVGAAQLLDQCTSLWQYCIEFLCLTPPCRTIIFTTHVSCLLTLLEFVFPVRTVSKASCCLYLVLYMSMTAFTLGSLLRVVPVHLKWVWRLKKRVSLHLGNRKIRSC